MLPVIAILGRPNVGKSTLFNRLTRTRLALVVDQPGVTRDRIYGEASVAEHRFLVVDTGGFAEEKTDIAGLTEKQTWQAAKEADVILFVVDARSGLLPADEMIAQKLRQLAKPIYLVVNKAEGLQTDMVKAEFYSLGLGDPNVISAAHGEGIIALEHAMLKDLPKLPEATEIATQGIKIAIVGKPNVGKSTLVNRLLGEERVLVFDLPGTTRDSVYIPLQRFEKQYTLIDTAGVRRRRAITEEIEKFSVIKTLQAIDIANVVIMVIDAQEGISEQDLRLLGFVIDAGKALIIAVNKWDGLPVEQKEKIKKEIDRRLDFVNFARLHFISALHGTGVGDLFNFIDEANNAATKELATPQLTKILEMAVENYQPPAFQGRMIKLRYAHAGGHNPPVIVIHGKRVSKLPMSYQRYLMNFFRQQLQLVGTPVRLVLKED